MALQAGSSFGNYRIVRLIGEGGFGEVYLAENPLLERRAAVKVLHTALAQDPELVRRFLNEARAASAIRHPNIIEVFDAGLTPDGAPYILMEFLEGVSLQKRLADQGRLGVAVVLDLVRQAGSALGAAHASGIVHRDLKPENLFLVPSPEAAGGERVKILDFGIAKIKRSGSTGGTMRTQTGLIMGSPAYMSPEQCKDSADVDLRSDIYSFGVIVYEALAGRTPFVASTGTEMLVMHLTETPPPLRQWAADVPAEIEAAVMRALSKQRSDRFESVASFVDALVGVATRTGFASAGPPAEGATQAQLEAGLERTIAAAAITTFSRASGQVDSSSSDEALLAASRPRRWPLVVFGGLAAAGLAVFLAARPGPASQKSQARPAAPASPAVAYPVAQPEVAPTAPNAPDAGTTPSAVVKSSGKSADSVPASKASKAVAKPAVSPQPRTRKRKSAEDDWTVH
jgi:serine/threonine-protein kinase